APHSRSISFKAKAFTPKIVTNLPRLQWKLFWHRPGSRGPTPGRTRNISSPSHWRRQSNLKAPVVSTLSAALAYQHNFADANPFVERLGHVVDRQRCNGG